MGLDTVEIVLNVEKKFGIEIPDERAAGLLTVGALHEFIVNELHRRERPRVDPHIVFDQLRQIICEQLGVKPEAVVPAARFVQDLHAD